MRIDIEPNQNVLTADRLVGAIGSDLVFHHIGVACFDLDREEEQFAATGYVREGDDFTDTIQGVSGRFLIGGGPRLELLRNQHEPGVLTPWLRKGIRFYHLAYEASDLDAQRRAFASRGAKEVVAPVPAIAFAGRLICFYMLPNRTLIELVSRT